MKNTLLDDLYISSIVKSKQLPSTMRFPGTLVVQEVQKIIKSWANQYLIRIYYSGSYAKTTGIIGSTDLDLFISLNPLTKETLGEIYSSLFDFLTSKGITAKKQNVSIGIKYMNISLDLIPSKKQSGNTNNHSIYKTKQNTWTLTNINKHIELVKNSGRLDEIRALKIWRDIHQLEFPSFYLELSVLESLSGKSYGQLTNNVRSALIYLKDELRKRRIVDPANSNNVISDDITIREKLIISQVASDSLSKSNWRQVIW